MVIGVTSRVSSTIGVLTGGLFVKEIVGDTSRRVSRTTQTNSVQGDASIMGSLGEIAGILSRSFIEISTCSTVGAVGQTIGEQNLHPDDSWAPKLLISSVDGGANVGISAR